jgi:hypothetical protein
MQVVDLSSLVVRPIEPREESAWDQLMSRYHYLGFRTIVGESLKYVALLQGQWVALVGWGTSALNCAPRDKWIGWSREQQYRRLRYVVNNQRFLILPGTRIKNLASKTLAMNTQRLSLDWEAIFGHPVVLAETFVDHERFRGTCYRAAGWKALGKTRGFGRSSGRYHHHGHPKTIFVRSLRPDACKLLSNFFLSPILKGDGGSVDLNKLSIRGPDGLWKRLSELRDPRKRRGIRHSQTSILAVAVCAVLSGARNFVAIGEWAQELSQKQLQRLGCRYHEDKRKFIPPSEPTIRRMLQSIDADALDKKINSWIASQAKGDAISVDGKTLKGARGPDGKRLHLMASLLHKQGVVLSQQEVDGKTNEIKAFRPTLDPVDLEGKVVTADAMHAQKDHASYLVEERKADYLFTVKANQKTLLEDIKMLDEDDFSPSAH